MGRIAGDSDCAAAGLTQAVDATKEPRQRVRPDAGAAGDSIGYARVGPQDSWDVLLVAASRCQKRQSQHELRARQWAHAAKNAQHLLIRFGHAGRLHQTASRGIRPKTEITEGGNITVFRPNEPLLANTGMT